MEAVLDNLDKKILSGAQKNPGTNIATLLRPLRGSEWTDPGLRLRVKSLAKDGYLRLQKTRTGKVLVYPNEGGD
jgi:hypothetical protein